MDRREREMLKRAERQRRWRPGDDEFDEQLRDWWVMPGIGMMWAMVVRAFRSTARKRSPARAVPAPEPQLTADATFHQPRRPLWTVGPKPLDKAE